MQRADPRWQPLGRPSLGPVVEVVTVGPPGVARHCLNDKEREVLAGVLMALQYPSPYSEELRQLIGLVCEDYGIVTDEMWELPDGFDIVEELKEELGGDWAP